MKDFLRLLTHKRNAYASILMIIFYFKNKILLPLRDRNNFIGHFSRKERNSLKPLALTGLSFGTHLHLLDCLPALTCTYWIVFGTHLHSLDCLRHLLALTGLSFGTYLHLLDCLRHLLALTGLSSALTCTHWIVFGTYLHSLDCLSALTCTY